jgi:hypothetical protein
VIVDDFNFKGIVVFPNEAYAPSIVDSYAVLSSTITPQLLKSIGWGNAKVVEIFGIVQIPELTIGSLLDILGKSPRTLPPEDLVGFRILDRLDHGIII